MFWEKVSFKLCINFELLFQSSRVEIIEKNTESQERVSLQLEKKIKEVERLGDDTSALWKQLTELQEYVNMSREDLRSIRTYFYFTTFLNTFHKRHKIWMTNTEWLDSHQLISNCSSGNIPNVKLKLCLYLGCILMNHSRGLKKSQHKLDAVLLHLKLTS